jgi:ribosome-associated toxin RatA of RatAB toxin-antitoxin module
VFATNRNRTAATGGHRARRFVVPGLLVAVLFVGKTSLAASDSEVAVHEKDGVYEVRATFSVLRPPSIVAAVLTDYLRIPDYMPEVRSSQVLERHDDHVVVEQEAVARFMMFSRRVRLVLEVTEGSSTIEFHDRCGQSFERYEGSWSMAERDGQTRIAYTLTAKPSFDVPDWLLSRLLKRDATQMIARLHAQIAAQ